jgi:Ni/Co efflux regulator RcnB
LTERNQYRHVVVNKLDSEEIFMKSHATAGLVVLILALGFGSSLNSAAAAPPNAQIGLSPIQYDRDRDQRRDDYNDRDFRGPHKWRPGEVLPGRLLNRVVDDWEERGLSRPPSGHQWVRVGEQFILVRGRDRMIARILNFD